MATSRRGRCVYTRFDRKILCAGTMIDWLIIERRDQQGITDPDTGASVEEFTTVESFAGRIEASRRTPRFDGVNTEDAKTHVAYIPYDQTVYELDLGSLFIRKEGTRDRRFTLKGISPYDEEEHWLEMELRETGFADVTAATA